MKKIAADRNYRNYRMLKRAQKKYSIDDFNVDENYTASGKSWKTNSAIVIVDQNPGMLDRNNENFYYRQALTEREKAYWEARGALKEDPRVRKEKDPSTGEEIYYTMHKKRDASYVTQDGKRIKGWFDHLSRDKQAALVFWSSSPSEGWVK